MAASNLGTDPLHFATLAPSYDTCSEVFEDDFVFDLAEREIGADTVPGLAPETMKDLAALRACDDLELTVAQTLPSSEGGPASARWTGALPYRLYRIDPDHVEVASRRGAPGGRR